MAHYRVYKLSDRDGRIVKAKDIEAPDHDVALNAARADPDCPVCEIWQHTKKVGTVE